MCRVHEPPSALVQSHCQGVVFHREEEGGNMMVLCQGGEDRGEVLVRMEGVVGGRKLCGAKRLDTHGCQVSADKVTGGMVTDPSCHDRPREVACDVLLRVEGVEWPARRHGGRVGR